MVLAFAVSGQFVEWLVVLGDRVIISTIEFLLKIVRHMKTIVILICIAFALEGLDYALDKGGSIIKVILDIIYLVIYAGAEVLGVAWGAIEDGLSFFHVSLPDWPLHNMPHTAEEAMPGLADLNNLETICRPFDDRGFMAFFLFRMALNAFLCPIFRFNWPSPILRVLQYPLRYATTFDCEPDLVHNCREPEAGWLCFIDRGAEFMFKTVIPAYFLVLFLMSYKRVIRQVVTWLEHLTEFFVYGTMAAIWRLHKRKVPPHYVRDLVLNIWRLA